MHWRRLGIYNRKGRVKRLSRQRATSSRRFSDDSTYPNGRLCYWENALETRRASFEDKADHWVFDPRIGKDGQCGRPSRYSSPGSRRKSPLGRNSLSYLFALGRQAVTLACPVTVAPSAMGV